MKLLVSSETLYKALSEFAFYEAPDYVSVLGIDENNNAVLNFTDGLTCSSADVVFIEGKPQEISAENHRWDWVQSLMKKADEQPVILEITQKSVKVIFEY